MQNTVNILGTDYKLIETNELESKDRDGETRNYSKEIYIRPTEKMFDDDSTYEEKEKRKKEVLRHELFHAFFYEMGDDDLALNEHLVNLLAIQTPKIFEVFNLNGQEVPRL